MTTSKPIANSPLSAAHQRMHSYYSLIKSLILNFETLEDGQSRMRDAYNRNQKHWLKDPLHFGDNSMITGVQSEFLNVQNQQSQIHEETAGYLNRSIIFQLNKLKKEVKHWLQSHGDLFSKNEKEARRDYDDRLQHEAKLNESLINAKGESPSFEVGDPWLHEMAVKRCIFNQQEHHRLRLQDAAARLKASININSKLQTIFGSLKNNSVLDSTFLPVRTVVENLDSAKEWQTFSSTLPTEPEPEVNTNFHGMNEPLSKIVKSGVVHRPKHILKGSKTCFLVLTAAGWLYEFENEHQLQNFNTNYEHRLFLRDCSLSPVIDDGNYNAISVEDANSWQSEISKFSKNVFLNSVPAAAVIGGVSENSTLGSAENGAVPATLGNDNSVPATVAVGSAAGAVGATGAAGAASHTAPTEEAAPERGVPGGSTRAESFETAPGVVAETTPTLPGAFVDNQADKRNMNTTETPEKVNSINTDGNMNTTGTMENESAGQNRTIVESPVSETNDTNLKNEKQELPEQAFNDNAKGDKTSRLADVQIAGGNENEKNANTAAPGHVEDEKGLKKKGTLKRVLSLFGKK
ncbi:hypothetical protein HK099_000248 [Clydaea vesicula]|uniref:SLM1/RGC1-like PH domain-containing protein n=1 Tax=Clydaea vesicula TaxID=447962 RepID=A0AAD5XSX5_9FUNG|nr:hypothetical protein HK099_000248 [Clydaea vesicula]